MRLILDVITVAVVGFTTVVAAWMVVRGVRRTSPRLMWAVVGTTAVAGLLQWVGPPVAADELTQPSGTTASPFPSVAATTAVVPSRTPAASGETAASRTTAPSGGPAVRGGAPAARVSPAAPVPSLLTGSARSPSAVPDPTTGATR